MLDEGRPAKLEGPASTTTRTAKRTGLWAGVKEIWGGENTDVPFEDLKERMMFTESLETVSASTRA